MAKFPNVFRSDDLSRRNIYDAVPSPTAPLKTQHLPQVQPISATFVPKSPSPAPSAESAGSSWATVGKANNAKNIDIASKKTPARRYMCLNQHEERVDEPLPQPDRMAQTRFDSRLKDAAARRHEFQSKCCNEYHLAGRCLKGEEYCGE